MNSNCLYIVTFNTPHSYIKVFTSNQEPKKVYQDHIDVYSNLTYIDSQNKVDTNIKLYFFTNSNKKVMLSILNELDAFSPNFYQFDKDITLLEKILQNCRDTDIILNKIKGVLNTNNLKGTQNKLILYNPNTTHIKKENETNNFDSSKQNEMTSNIPLEFNVSLFESNNNIKIDISRKNNKQFKEWCYDDIKKVTNIMDYNTDSDSSNNLIDNDTSNKTVINNDNIEEIPNLDNFVKLHEPKPVLKPLQTIPKLPQVAQCNIFSTNTSNIINSKDKTNILIGEQEYEDFNDEDSKLGIPLIDSKLYSKMEKYTFESAKAFKDMMDERDSLSFDSELPIENSKPEPTGNSKNYPSRKRQLFNFSDYASVESCNTSNPIATENKLETNIAFIKHKGKSIQNALLVTSESLLLVKEMSYFNEFVILNEFITPEDQDYYSCVKLKVNKLLTKDNKTIDSIIDEMYSILNSVNTFLGYQCYDSFLTTQYFNKKTTTMDKILKYFSVFSQRYIGGCSDDYKMSLDDIKTKFHEYLLEKESNTLSIDEINKYESAICQYLVFHKNIPVYINDKQQRVFRLKEKENFIECDPDAHIFEVGKSTIGVDSNLGNHKPSLQLRPEPANPYVQVSPWRQSTIVPNFKNSMEPFNFILPKTFDDKLENITNKTDDLDMINELINTKVNVSQLSESTLEVENDDSLHEKNFIVDTNEPFNQL
jgi:hypothetical protein